MMRSAKTKLTTPPKLMPLLHSTAASGRLPILHTKLATATRGPMNGPQSLATSGCDSKKNERQKPPGTHASMHPAMNRPMTMSRATAAHSMTKFSEMAVQPRFDTMRRMDVALGRHRHVHGGVALHGARHRLIGLGASGLDGLGPDDEPKPQGQQHDHHRAADIFGQREPPPEQ